MNAAAGFLLDVTVSADAARPLRRALQDAVVAVRVDRRATWRIVSVPDRSRWLGRWLDRPLASGRSFRGVIEPGLFPANVGAALPALFAAAAGAARIAVLHDPRELRVPESAPAARVARMPAYLHELAGFDFILAASADERDSLLEFWRWAGVASRAEVIVLSSGEIAPWLLALPAR